jgi:hypothetical protein
MNREPLSSHFDSARGIAQQAQIAPFGRIPSLDTRCGGRYHSCEHFHIESIAPHLAVESHRKPIKARLQKENPNIRVYHPPAVAVPPGSLGHRKGRYERFHQ